MRHPMELMRDTVIEAAELLEHLCSELAEECGIDDEGRFLAGKEKEDIYDKMSVLADELRETAAVLDWIDPTGWISLADSLPPEDGRYLTCAPGSIWPVQISQWMQREQVWEHERSRNARSEFPLRRQITHWMPVRLPGEKLPTFANAPPMAAAPASGKGGAA